MISNFPSLLCIDRRNTGFCLCILQKIQKKKYLRFSTYVRCSTGYEKEIGQHIFDCSLNVSAGWKHSLKRTLLTHPICLLFSLKCVSFSHSSINSIFNFVVCFIKATRSNTNKSGQILSKPCNESFFLDSRIIKN